MARGTAVLVVTFIVLLEREQLTEVRQAEAFAPI